MANSIVGYTNDLSEGRVTYEGGETNTAVVEVDNVEYKIYANVKNSAIGKPVPADASISVSETDLGSAIKVNLSQANKNILSLKDDGIFADAPSREEFERLEDKVDYTQSELANVKTNVLEIKQDVNRLDLTKQDKLIAGKNIKIEGNIISAEVEEGSRSYEDLKDLPSINDVTLKGNRTTKDLHIHYEDLENLPDIPDVSGLASKDYVKHVVDKIENFKIVKSLPEGDAINKHTIYLIRRDPKLGIDVYDEFVYLDDEDSGKGQWERLGSPEKQDKLVDSGENQNIKTINGLSILGSGNIEIKGGEGTGDYNDLTNKPSINGNPLVGNKSSAELGLITKAVNDLENYYLKDETYTKEEVREIIDGLEAISFKKVDELPEVGETNKIYLVPNGKGSYDEYLYIDNKWDKIGSLDTDLSNYYTKEEADAKFLTEHQDISGLATKEELAEVESKIPDVSNFATKEELNTKQDLISDLETIRSGAALGATAIQEHQDISHLATKVELAEVEAKIPSLDGYAKEEYVDTKVEEVKELIPDVSGLATKDYVDEQDEAIKALIPETVWEKGEGSHSVQTKGNNNQAKGEASVAEGAEVDAHAFASHAEGYMTSTGASADYSHAEGYKTTTQGVASHAEGDNTVTNNPAEHAEGRYNKSNMGGTEATNTIHSIGIGNASGSIPGGERKNAFEVMQNGDAYLIGVGEYDGKNPSDAQTLQEAINNKQDKLTAGAGIKIEDNVISAISTQPAYDNLVKVQDYLFEVNYSNLDYKYASEHTKANKNLRMAFSCSSVRKGNFYGRNFDWTYSHGAEFIVKTPRASGRFATIGVSGQLEGLTGQFVESGEYSDLYKLVPFMIVDGINECGLVVNNNVVPLEKNRVKTTGTVPVGELEVELNSLMVPRFLLDNFKTAQEAVEYLRDHASIYTPDQLANMNYEVHFMVADKDHTFIVETVNNQVVILPVDEKPFMTNFYLDDVVFNEDGSVYTPETQTRTKDAIKTNNITEHGSGLERYNLINESYESLEDKDSMRSLMNALKYTNAYNNEQDPFWYTEFVGDFTNSTILPEDLRKNYTCASNTATLDPIADVSIEAFNNRSRDDKTTWQTSHSNVYDIENKKLYIIAQENGIELEFRLDYYTADQIDEIVKEIKSEIPEQLKAGENVSIVNGKINAIDTKYTAGEGIDITNNVISTIGSGVMGRDFTTTVKVGHLEAGTKINSDDKISDILYRILFKEGPSMITLYIGKSDNIPGDIDGLTSIEVDPSEFNNGDGAIIQLPSVANQYSVIACPKTYNLPTGGWMNLEPVKGPLTFGQAQTTDYNIYYINVPDPEYDDDGRFTMPDTKYGFKFREV